LKYSAPFLFGTTLDIHSPIISLETGENLEAAYFEGDIAFL